ncbi:hypothetical protein TNCT_667471 [Trichonephila clavata]|uniref:Bowman-Birk serine protease inhibitors family domain-containing protein n=1 Tax=Trichonephila clavata TaxID=2740835 RepID=A0A8X6IND8_TRICU|nr:hypothetical protein TNCT_667471 [Trichonephila clavata]
MKILIVLAVFGAVLVLSDARKTPKIDFSGSTPPPAADAAAPNKRTSKAGPDSAKTTASPTSASSPDSMPCDPVPCTPPCRMNNDNKPCPKCECGANNGAPNSNCQPPCRPVMVRGVRRCDCRGN